MDDNSRSLIDSPDSSPPAFVAVEPKETGVPVLLAAPHGGRSYPASVVEAMRQPDYAKLRLEDRHVDTLAIETARLASAPLIYATIPRAMIDLNRSSDDVDWAMISGGESKQTRHSLSNRRSRSGLGLVPRRLSGSGEIWKGPLPREVLHHRIETIHRPYHQALASALAKLRDRWGAALLLDIHSMPPLTPRHRDERAAEFVIGDRFGSSCDPMLSSLALSYFGRNSRAAAHNRPYSGGYVLDVHGCPARGIHALQIEVCRGSYLDARLSEPSARLPTVARLLAGLVSELAKALAEAGGAPDFSIAAE